MLENILPVSLNTVYCPGIWFEQLALSCEAAEFLFNKKSNKVTQCAPSCIETDLVAVWWNFEHKIMSIRMEKAQIAASLGCSRKTSDLLTGTVFGIVQSNSTMDGISLRIALVFSIPDQINLCIICT